MGAISRVVRVLGLGAVVAASLVGCARGGAEGEGAAPGGGGPGGGDVEQPTATTTPSTTVITPPTTVISPPAPDPAPVPDDDGARFARPGDAAAHLYQAWRDDDPRAAAEAADAVAVDALFAREWSEPGFTGSECRENDLGTHRCFMDGDGEHIVFEVTGTDETGHHVTSASFVTNQATPDDSPSVVASPGRATVGATVRIEGDGFLGEPWTTAGATLYLVGGADGCALHAVADHDVEVDGDGHLVGDVVIPAVGDCRMSDAQADVLPGRYQLAYACTACFIGEIEVVA